MLPEIKIGDISFLNTLPLRWGLSRLGLRESFLGTPTEVNQALLREEIDLGPVSSIFYLENQSKFLALKDFCIASRGKVKSVILLSRYPLEELDNKFISLTRASATSRRLLQLILKAKGLNPRYVTGEIEEFNKGKVDASLLIGDVALRVNLGHLQIEKPYYLYDLGEEWQGLTGKPMVFALWVVRKEVAKFQPEVIKEVSELFLAALESGLSQVELVAKQGEKISKIKAEQLKDYFLNLNYYLNLDCFEGLLEFYRRVSGEKMVKLEFFPFQPSLIGICKE